MSTDIKALIVVLALAATIFALGRPIALRFMNEEDFSRRRLVWFVLTTVSFVSPNFWVYALVAAPILLSAYRNEANPIAVYLFLLHVAPPVAVTIPLLGHGLFGIDNYRLLALCVLLPATIRYRKENDRAEKASIFGAMDILLLAFGALQVALYVPPDLPYHFFIPDSPINALRRALLFLLDVYLPYFAVSRICQSRKQLRDAVAAFCLGCAVMAALAMFERARHWLLFVDITSRWNAGAGVPYLSRGGSVRAQVSAGHSIALGYLLVIAFGFWLGLKSHVQKMRHIGVTLLFWGGLWGAFSRGGWLGGAVVFFTFNIFGPRAISRTIKGVWVALALAAVIAATPLGDAVLDLLPKTGQPVDEYRHLLAKRGWEVALANPFFGDQFPWPKLEDLRQGEGIIDLVNTYLSVALNYGLVGLFLFLGFILLGLIRTYLRVRQLTRFNPDFALFGASLIACIVGTLIMIDNMSFVLGCQRMFYVLAGFTTAYAAIPESLCREPDVTSVSNTRRDKPHVNWTE